MSCGGGSREQGLVSHSMPSNQKDVENLQGLMKEHPELSRASLKEIKNAALGTGNLHPDFRMAYSASADSEGGLDPELAKKAQMLVDNILDNFDMMAQIRGSIKIMGIVMNMNAETLAKMNKGPASKKDFSPKSKMDSEDNFSEEKAMPSCQQFVDQTLNELPKEQTQGLHDLLKSTLSGCAKIRGEVFVQCIDNWNRMFSIVDQYATCSMNNFDELTKIHEQEVGKSFEEINKFTMDCIEKEFSQCGFKMSEQQK